MLSVSPPTTHTKPTHSLATPTSTSDFESLRPKWVPNNTVTACTSCEHEFTLFFRRHHCRACGKIFCNKCSEHYSAIPQLGYFKPTRVCNMCVQRCSSHETPPHSTRKPKFPRSPALPSNCSRSFVGRDRKNNLNYSPTTLSLECMKEEPRMVHFSNDIGKSSNNRSSTNSVRLWLPDTTSDACHQCQKPFQRIGSHRRHHCRSCARVFCHDCSSRTVSSTRLSEVVCCNPAKETMERVCRRCYSRIISTDSTFGRLNLTMKHIVLIIKWFDISMLGKMYYLNVQWHGMMSSSTVDSMIWSPFCLAHGLSTTAGTNRYSEKLINNTQPFRSTYLRTIGIQNVKVAMSMLEKESSISCDAARSLMMITATPLKSWVGGTVNKNQDVFEQLIPTLVSTLNKVFIENRSTSRSENRSEINVNVAKICLIAGTLFNCTRLHTHTCKNIILYGGIPVLLSVARDITLLPTKLKKTSTHNVYLMDTLVHTTGALWNIFRCQSKDTTNNNYTVHSSDILTVFGTRIDQFSQFSQHSVVEGRMLQIISNCCGLISCCCYQNIKKSDISALLIAEKSALSSLIRAVSNVYDVVHHRNSNKMYTIQEVERFFRVACSTLRCAMLENKGAKLAMNETKGLSVMMKLLVWEGDHRVPESAGAVICNFTSAGFDSNNTATIQAMLCNLLTHIGTGSLNMSQSWEHCSGAVCNCTSSGIEVHDTTVYTMLFSRIKFLFGMANISRNSLTSLCGAACNLSLIYTNAVYFKQFQHFLKQSIVKNYTSDMTTAVGYVKQTLKNLEFHEKVYEKQQQYRY
jgi:hypothetical protein